MKLNQILYKLKWWIKHELKQISYLMPVTTKYMADTLLDEAEGHRKEIDRLKEKHEKELKETKRTIDEIVSKYTLIDLSFDQKQDHYIVSVSFSPQLTKYGSLFGHEKEMIAEQLAWKVKHEIISAVFVKPYEPK